MPKNVVKRLQNLENEIKTVLSIYDISSQEAAQNATNKKVVHYGANSVEHRTNTCSQQKDENQLESLKGILVSRKPQKEVTNFTSRNEPFEKPSSAPTSGSASINETEGHSKRKRSLTRHRTSGKGESLATVESSEWFDCTPQNYELPETPEPELRPTENIRTDINQYEKENYFSNRSTLWCATCQRKTFDCVCHDKRSRLIRCQSEEFGEHEDVKTVEMKKYFQNQAKTGIDQNPLLTNVLRQVEQNELQSFTVNQTNSAAKIKNHQSESVSNAQAKCRGETEEPEDGREFISTCLGDQSHSEEILAQPPSQVFYIQKIPDQIYYAPAQYFGRPVTAPTKTESLEESSTPARSDRTELKKRNKWNDNNRTRRDTIADPYDGNASQRTNVDLIPDEDRKNATEEHKHPEAAAPNKTNRYRENQLSNQQVFSISDSDDSRNQQEDFLNLKQKKNLSKATILKIAEIIEKNHEKIEELRQSKHLAYSMVKNIKEKYYAMALVKEEMSKKLQKLIDKNESLAKEVHEMKHSKQHFFENWEKFKKDNSEIALLNKFKNLSEANTLLTEKVQILQHQLQDRTNRNENKRDETIESNAEMSQVCQQKCYEYNVPFERQEAAYRKLTEKINVLEKVIKSSKEKEKRFSEIKIELKKRATKTQCYLQRLSSEKLGLIQTINDLRTQLDDGQSKIQKLQDQMIQKDEYIERQKSQLKEKTDTLEETNKKLESVRKKSLDLEEQMKTLRKSIENFDQVHQNLLKEKKNYEDLIERVQGENVKLQEQLTIEKDALLIKNKIIDDQQETIKQLKEKFEEANTALKRNQSIERLINFEREEKLKLQETVEHLKWRKEELKQKVKSLEGDLLLAPQEIVRDLQKTQIVLHELENQVQIKQKEWEIHLQSVLKEKEQACNVAAFATKKLLQTTNEFQKQSVAHKQLYKMLADNLAEKKRSVPDTTEKVKPSVRFSDDLETLPKDSSKNENHHESKKPVKSTERFRYYPKHVGILKKRENSKESDRESSGAQSSEEIDQSEMENDELYDN